MTQPIDTSDNSLDRLSQSLAMLAEQALGLRSDMERRDNALLEQRKLEAEQRRADAKQRKNDRLLLKVVLAMGSILVAAVVVSVQFSASKDRTTGTRDLIKDGQRDTIVAALKCFEETKTGTGLQFLECLRDSSS
jgi:hypothetical protein